MPNRGLLPVACLIVLVVLGCGRVKNPAPTVVGRETKPAEPLIKATDDPRTILAKVSEVYGGPAKARRWKTGRVEYRSNLEALAAPQGAEVRIKDTFQLPGQFKREMTVSYKGESGSTIWVTNKGKAWEKRHNEPVQEIVDDFSQNTEHPFWRLCDFTSCLEEGVTLTVLGERQVEGKQAILVRAKSQTMPETELYIDQHRAILVKAKRRAFEPFSKKESMLESYFRDFQDVQGGIVPMSFTVLGNGRRVMEAAILKVEFLDKIDDSEFARP